MNLRCILGHRWSGWLPTIRGNREYRWCSRCCKVEMREGRNETALGEPDKH